MTILKDFISEVRRYLKSGYEKIEYFYRIAPNDDGKHFHIHVIFPHVQMTEKQKREVAKFWLYGFVHFKTIGKSRTMENELLYITRKPKGKDYDRVFAYLREYHIRCYGQSNGFWQSVRSLGTTEPAARPQKKEYTLSGRYSERVEN